MIEQFRPRDIYEMTELFEDLLLMRMHKFLSDKEDTTDEPALTVAGKQLLGKLGLTGRIFRRWYQTTWGWDSPSRWFQGETPRMELCKYYPDLATGNSYTSAQLLQSQSAEVKVVPSLYEKEEIEKAQGIIALGLSFLPKTLEARSGFHSLPAPNLDPEFKEFIGNLEAIEREIIKAKIEKLPIAVEAKYWQIFWSDACITIPLNCGLKLAHNALLEVGAILRAIIQRTVEEQASTAESYVNFDNLFFAIWQVFCDFDPALLSLRQVHSSKTKSITELANKTNGPYSLNVYYNLGNLLDELLLFPADRYFGACECVWTDKENFLNDLAMSFTLLNNNLQLPDKNRRQSKAQKSFQRDTAIEEKNLDIYRIWFCPPTCFRILPKFIKYF